MIRRARHQPIRRENYARARAKRPWLIPIDITPTGAMVKHGRYNGLSTEELEDLYMSTRKRLRTIERLLATRQAPVSPADFAGAAAGEDAPMTLVQSMPRTPGGMQPVPMTPCQSMARTPCGLQPAPMTPCQSMPLTPGGMQSAPMTPGQSMPLTPGGLQPAPMTPGQSMPLTPSGLQPAPTTPGGGWWHPLPGTPASAYPLPGTPPLMGCPVPRTPSSRTGCGQHRFVVCMTGGPRDNGDVPRRCARCGARE